MTMAEVRRVVLSAVAGLIVLPGCVTARGASLAASLKEIMASVPDDGTCAELKLAMMEQVDAIDQSRAGISSATTQMRITTARMTETAMLRAVSLRKACVDLAAHVITPTQYNERIAAIFVPESASFGTEGLRGMREQMRELDAYLKGRDIPTPKAALEAAAAVAKAEVVRSTLGDTLAVKLQAFHDRLVASIQREIQAGARSVGEVEAVRRERSEAIRILSDSIAGLLAASQRSIPADEDAALWSERDRLRKGELGQMLDAKLSALWKQYGPKDGKGGGKTGTEDDSQKAGGGAGRSQAEERKTLPVYSFVDSMRLLFPFGSAHLSEEQYVELGRKIGCYRDQAISFAIVGMADETGPASHNETLSLARARAVSNWLIRDLGVPPTRIVREGIGAVTAEGGVSSRQRRAVLLYALANNTPVRWCSEKSGK